MGQAMKELRIGLVLYGGVSLAVYINGVTTEIWHALRASQSIRRTDGQVTAPAWGSGSELTGSAAVYRDLLDELRTSPEAEDLRVVVDAIAGTSAGGLNGTVLGKAIVEGGDASVLNRVWIRSADIDALRSEPTRAPWPLRVAFPSRLHGATLLSRNLRQLRRKVQDLPGISWRWARDTAWSFLFAEDGRTSPLDGKYFTQMIATALKQMGTGPALLPNRGTLDLFVTRTDLFGWPRHLPLSREFHPVPLFERHHAHMMAFHRRPSLSDAEPKLGRRFEPLGDFDLTFAARTTAGFPGAFAPVAYESVAADYHSVRCDAPPPNLDEFARRHLREHELEAIPVGCTWMVDGGVLDNKPFTDLTKAIEAKSADHEIYRVVAYIEPDPSPLGRPDQTSSDYPPEDCPVPLSVLQRLYGVVRSEPIYEDLRRLDGRNHKVEALKCVRDSAFEDAVRTARQAGKAAGLAEPLRLADLDRWREATNEIAASSQLSGYPGYVALKARRAASIASDAFCRALDLPYHSRHGYFVRKLVRSWLDRKKLLDPPRCAPGGGYRVTREQRTFLEGFDLPFRLRRLRFLVQAINKHYRGRIEPGTSEAEAAAHRRDLDSAKQALADISFQLEESYRDVSGLQENLSRAFGDLSSDDINAAIDELDRDGGPVIETYDRQLGVLYCSMLRQLSQRADELNKSVPSALSELHADVQPQVAEALVAFPVLDVLLYPLMEAAEVEDLFEVRTMRFSPDDRSLLAPVAKPLKGRELGAFAGFLKRESREHDLLWGRLDGAERLIELIFKASVPEGPGRANLEHVRDRYVRLAIEAVLDEAGRDLISTASLVSEIMTHLRARTPGAGPAVA
jgi:patatin-related protein